MRHDKEKFNAESFVVRERARAAAKESRQTLSNKMNLRQFICFSLPFGSLQCFHKLKS